MGVGYYLGSTPPTIWIRLREHWVVTKCRNRINRTETNRNRGVEVVGYGNDHSDSRPASIMAVENRKYDSMLELGLKV